MLPEDAPRSCLERRTAGSAEAEGVNTSSCVRRGTNSLYIVPLPALHACMHHMRNNIIKCTGMEFDTPFLTSNEVRLCIPDSKDAPDGNPVKTFYPRHDSTINKSACRDSSMTR